MGSQVWGYLNQGAQQVGFLPSSPFLPAYGSRIQLPKHNFFKFYDLDNKVQKSDFTH
jgi:hypothetical protein